MKTLQELPLEILTSGQIGGVISGKVFIVGGPRPYLKIELIKDNGQEVGVSLSDRNYKKLANQFAKYPLKK